MSQSPQESTAFLHIVRVDIDPAYEQAFNRWYDEVHVPALLACPGWLSARRFISIEDGPKYAAIYDVAGDWAYDTPEFNAVKGFMEFTPHVRNFMRQRLRPVASS
ncbi:DUF4286 family protein [Caenimonas soli]|uniref:DUF4286 family protein n=1 Tax=Caenimonas soli TaxID=2735555 RepID=UPI001552A26A|nr:DUF4286 family protein [Caenimonas soli]NPC55977.1 hypothetical protein [Caenimonas soli]